MRVGGEGDDDDDDDEEAQQRWEVRRVLRAVHFHFTQATAPQSSTVMHSGDDAQK